MRILYCEDDEYIREFGQAVIEKAFPDCLIIICTNGIEGKEQLDAMKFDLIVSDYQMNVKNGDGIALYKYARSTYKENFNFVMISSHGRETFIEYIEDKNFFYLPKSVLHEEVHTFSDSLRQLGFLSTSNV